MAGATTTIPDLSRDDEATLEGLIDRYGLAAVILALAGICWGKAEHIDTTWQDRDLSRAWQRAATLLDKQIEYAAIRDVP
jgi:hypothetical protein